MEHMETIAGSTKAEATGHFHDQKEQELLIMQRSLTEHGATFKYFSVSVPGCSHKCAHAGKCSSVFGKIRKHRKSADVSVPCHMRALKQTEAS